MGLGVCVQMIELLDQAADHMGCGRGSWSSFGRCVSAGQVASTGQRCPFLAGCQGCCCHRARAAGWFRMLSSAAAPMIWLWSSRMNRALRWCTGSRFLRMGLSSWAIAGQGCWSGIGAE